MEQTLEQQSTAFLWSFVLGAVLAVIYIIIVAVRTISPPGRVHLFISDFLFMTATGLLNFIFAVSQTEGSVRYYTIIAEIISFSLFYFTIGRMIKKLFRIAVYYIDYFFKIIFGFAMNLCKKMIIWCQKKKNKEKS